LRSEIIEDRPGVYHFVCEDCDADVHAFGTKPPRPLCSMCDWLRFHGKDLPEAEKARLRGGASGLT
jgi:hypothetical protein